MAREPGAVRAAIGVTGQFSAVDNLLGTPIGSGGVVAVAWCAFIALSGHLWARDLYERGAKA